jgi:glycine cleavage system aminomethyltransferase T
MSFLYIVTGDYMQYTISRHHSLEAAERAARTLDRRWRRGTAGKPCGYGARPMVRYIETGLVLLDLNK